jgi:hypothetical protein
MACPFFEARGAALEQMAPRMGIMAQYTEETPI